MRHMRRSFFPIGLRKSGGLAGHGPVLDEKLSLKRKKWVMKHVSTPVPEMRREDPLLRQYLSFITIPGLVK